MWGSVSLDHLRAISLSREWKHPPGELDRSITYPSTPDLFTYYQISRFATIMSSGITMPNNMDWISVYQLPVYQLPIIWNWYSSGTVSLCNFFLPVDTLAVLFFLIHWYSKEKWKVLRFHISLGTDGFNCLLQCCRSFSIIGSWEFLNNFHVFERLKGDFLSAFLKFPAVVIGKTLYRH